MGDRPLPDMESVGVGELHGRKRLPGVDLHQREVGGPGPRITVPTNERPSANLTVAFPVARSFYDVIVGQHIAIGAYDDARPGARTETRRGRSRRRGRATAILGRIEEAQRGRDPHGRNGEPSLRSRRSPARRCRISVRKRSPARSPLLFRERRGPDSARRRFGIHRGRETRPPAPPTSAARGTAL